MTTNPKLSYPTTSPWGPVTDATPYGTPGDDHCLWFVSTASHGGFYVPPMPLRRIPIEARRATWNGQGVRGWFEEDRDATLIVVFFPEHFSRAQVESARASRGLEAKWKSARAAAKA